MRVWESVEMNERVDHPKHYRREDRKECIEEMREKFGDFVAAVFCLTNAYKYLYRAGMKEGSPEKEDIAKAKRYFEYFKTIPYCCYGWDKNVNELCVYIKKEIGIYEDR